MLWNVRENGINEPAEMVPVPRISNIVVMFRVVGSLLLEGRTHRRIFYDQFATRAPIEVESISRFTTWRIELPRNGMGRYMVHDYIVAATQRTLDPSARNLRVQRVALPALSFHC